MEVSVGRSWDGMVDTLVRSGRHASATQVVEERLRLEEEREKQRDRLRARSQKAIDGGGSSTDEEVGVHLDDLERKLQAEGRRPVRRVRYADDALRSLGEIFTYVRDVSGSEPAGRRRAAAIRARCSQPADLPGITGRTRPDLVRNDAPSLRITTSSLVTETRTYPPSSRSWKGTGT